MSSLIVNPEKNYQEILDEIKKNPPNSLGKYPDTIRLIETNNLKLKSSPKKVNHNEEKKIDSKIIRKNIIKKEIK